MSDKKKLNEVPKTEPKPQANFPNVYDAKVIRTDKGPGLLVETRMLDGSEVFAMTHLGTAHQFPLSLEAAKALSVLLDEWIEYRQPWGKASFAVAT